MPNTVPADDLLNFIRQFVDVCKRYDPTFDQQAPSYGGGNPFQLSLHGVPEEEIERVAKELGQPMSRPIDFGYGTSPPTAYASCFITTGSLSVFLCSKRRPATHAEIDAAMSDIRRRVVPGSVPGTPIAPRTSNHKGDLA